MCFEECSMEIQSICKLYIYFCSMDFLERDVFQLVGTFGLYLSCSGCFLI